MPALGPVSQKSSLQPGALGADGVAPNGGSVDARVPPPEGDYATIPYVSNAFPQTHPARLFGFARLFGLAVPEMATARVLELGCASGGNIIPIASQYPNAQVLGLDLAERHVEEANARIRKLGLTNIVVRHGDIATFSLGAECFDAIICHGVYSWAPPAVRSSILRIAGDNLSQTGVAYVSYNTLPGWHLRSSIRDLMLYHAGNQGTAPAADRVAKARWVLETVANATNADRPYGAKLRQEAATLAKRDDSYILGEFLMPYNEPCYVHDFIASAEQAGLAFLCESDLETGFPETFGAEVAKTLRTLSANKLIDIEQYIDFVLGRPFRQSLLVRKGRQLDRNLSSHRVAGLHVHGRLDPAPEHSGPGRFAYRAQQERTIATASPVVRQALDQFASAFPESRTCEELIQELRSQGLSLTSVDERLIRETIFKMIAGGMVKPSSVRLRVGRADETFPISLPLARADASAGRPRTTNLKHEPVLLDPMSCVLLPHLDGTMNKAALRTLLKEAVTRNRLAMIDEKTKGPVQSERVDAEIFAQIDRALVRFAATALLVPNQMQFDLAAPTPAE